MRTFEPTEHVTVACVRPSMGGVGAKFRWQVEYPGSGNNVKPVRHRCSCGKTFRNINAMIIHARENDCK